MDKPKTFPVTFPLFEGYTRVSDALKQAQLNSATAVVSTDGKGFWLHKTFDLAKAAETSPSQILGAFQDQKLPVLSTARASKLGLDLTGLDETQARKVFPTHNIEVVVTSVCKNFSGDRMVVALANPEGAFKIVGKVWVCPKGQEHYSSPGICPTHNVVLQRGS
jgi:hypothetical protein